MDIIHAIVKHSTNGEISKLQSKVLPTTLSPKDNKFRSLICVLLDLFLHVCMCVPLDFKTK